MSDIKENKTKEEEIEITSEDNKDKDKEVKKENKKEKKSEKKESKKEEKKETSQDSKTQIKELNDKILRQMAEFENYRKRTDKEKAVMYELGIREVIVRMLSVMDNFERGLKEVEKDESKKDDPFTSGMEMVYKELTKQFEELGVTKIKAIDCEFDPNLHNAVMHEEDESDERKNIIIEEFQTGYKLKDSLIRPSMVKVLN